MLKFIRLIISLVIAALLIAFAVANHESVTISLDPFSARETAAFSFDAPMYLVMVACLAVGVVLGGMAVWFGQGRYRRASRQLRRETEKLKANLKSVEAKSPGPVARRA